MRSIRYIIPVLIAALLLGGCRSQSALRKQKAKEEQESERLIHTLLEAPPVQELTASLSLNLSGTKVSGQLRMRRGRSIQISASMLGLVEIARIEFLPEMVVVMDKFHNLYSVCHYADIPYRNELGLDFEVVQAFLWNRIFAPGSANVADASTRLRIDRTDDQGKSYIKDIEYGYEFVANADKRLEALGKSGSGYTFNIDYSDFTALSGKWEYPLGVNCQVKVSDFNLNVQARMSSVSTENKTWPDRTQVTRRMKQVSIDELLDNLDL
ncbi:MAG: DUF4292 domain-containing protein [Bacteroidaceae bacterium]|nr:DUF4292 domain-containing protein [Bacteroidaceae bacterium]